MADEEIPGKVTALPRSENTDTSAQAIARAIQMGTLEDLFDTSGPITIRHELQKALAKDPDFLNKVREAKPVLSVVKAPATGLDEERIGLAGEAAGQIESLIRTLGRELNSEEDQESFKRTLLSCLKRMEDLNGVVLSVACNDEQRTTDELRRVIYM